MMRRLPVKSKLELVMKVCEVSMPRDCLMLTRRNRRIFGFFFEVQLKVAVNFCIHRLNLMQYRQKEDETLDEFVTCARTQAQMCEFNDTEMPERIIKLVIAGIRMEDFRRELLGKEKGLTLQEALNEGCKQEAAAMGTQQLQSLQSSVSSIDHVKKKKICGKCGLNHKYKN